MIQNIYVALRDAIINSHTDINYVDWYARQDQQAGETSLRTTPAAFVQFMPISYSDLSSRRQRADISFTVRLVSHNLYEGEEGMLNTTTINHMAIHDAIFRALQGSQYDSATSGVPLIQSISRTKATMPHDQSNLLITTQTFTANADDITATDTPGVDTTTILAMLCLEVELVKQIAVEPLIPDTQLARITVSTSGGMVGLADSSIGLDSTYVRKWYTRAAGDDSEWIEQEATGAMISIPVGTFSVRLERTLGAVSYIDVITYPAD
jgi:hypothetical protein